MATISINMVGVETAFSLTDEDAGRILTAYTAMMSGTDANGAPAIPTPVEVVQRISTEVVASLAANARAWEQAQAGAAARDAVPALEAVPEF